MMTVKKTQPIPTNNHNSLSHSNLSRFALFFLSEVSLLPRQDCNIWLEPEEDNFVLIQSTIDGLPDSRRQSANAIVRYMAGN